MHGENVPENSLPAFAAAVAMGAGIECDLRLTADNCAVTFHDRDMSRLCGTPATVRGSVLAGLPRLSLSDEPIPTLEELLDLVAGQVPLLLELKADRDARRWAPVLANALASYRGRFGVMSFDPLLMRVLKLRLPGVRRGLVIGARLSPFHRRLAMSLASPQFVAVSQAAIEQPWVAALRRIMPVYSWTVRTVEERAQASVHADALIWEADGRPRI